MKFLTAAILAITLAGCAGSGGTCCMSGSAGVLRHVVLFKFKDTATPDQVKSVEDKFRTLKDRIPGITAYEWGTNVSPEKLDQGFTHCFFVSFADAKARDAYLPHPAHKEFVDVLRPHLDKVLVIDYVARE